MPHILEDRVLELSTSVGAGDFALTGAVQGFRAFSAVCAIGDTVPYFIEGIDTVGQPSGEYEYGTGTYSAAGVLTRTTVLGSSNAGAAVVFSAGDKNVGIALNASELQSRIVSNKTPVAASGTSVDFTSIPSWAKRITISLSGISTSGASEPLIQIGDSGGIENAGYSCVSSGWVGGAAPANTVYATGFGILSASAGNALHGSLTLTLIDPATNTWAIQGAVVNPGGSGFVVVAGSKSLSATLDRIRLTTVGGVDTFDAGKVNIQIS